MSRPRKFTDSEILKVAAQVFEEGGLQASTERIAQELGISQPALFKRFGTKKELSFRAVLFSLNQNLAGYLSEISYDKREFKVQLIERCEKTCAFMQTQMPKIRLMQSLGIDLLIQTIPQDESPPIKHHRAMTRWFQAAIDAGHIKPSSAKNLATIFMGAMIAHVQLRDFSDTEITSVKAYSKVVANTLIKGLNPVEEHHI